jgi:F0F1-type ATP synthase membrane subunit c/vacuolar-type H+-ATPase subunit K
MRFNHRSPTHWLAVAVVAAVALFTFGHARGQGATAAAAFEGRPALAGAQGGLGAQSGVAQGGVGVQGNEAAQRQLTLRKPSGLDSTPAAPVAATTPAVDAAAAPVSRRSEVTLVPKGDDVARQERSPTRTVKKAARRTVERSRTGVGGIDAVGGTPK